MLAILLSTSIASAAIDPACQEVADQGVPDGYSEQGQQDWLLNYFSMVGAFSPLHGVIPHKPGTGAMGVELAVIPLCHVSIDSSSTTRKQKIPINFQYYHGHVSHLQCRLNKLGLR